MARVEFVWAHGCPNVKPARANLMRAIAEAGGPASWQEWCSDDPGCPEPLRRLGSPAIVVDGRDIAGQAPGDGEGCRIYLQSGGASAGIPPVGLIVDALRSADGAAAVDGGSRFGWRRLAAVVPSLGVALLPKVACPACWPAYASALGALGVTFLIDTQTLFAVTAVFLGVALLFLGWRARRRRGYGPLLMGAVASACLLVGKFAFESDGAMYGGVGLLMIASLWNAWPRAITATGPTGGACCPPATAVGADAARPPAACCGPALSEETP